VDEGEKIVAVGDALKRSSFLDFILFRCISDVKLLKTTSDDDYVSLGYSYLSNATWHCRLDSLSINSMCAQTSIFQTGLLSHRSHGVHQH
jgi:hypothetical protein